MANEKVSEVREAEFNKIIKDKKNPLVVVDFFAEWCSPCLMMAPVIESLAEKNKDVKFAKVNVDDNNELAGKYEVSGIPCIIFFKNGKEVSRKVGAQPEESIQEEIDSLK